MHDTQTTPDNKGKKLRALYTQELNEEQVLVISVTMVTLYNLVHLLTLVNVNIN